jgi:hypothetical protein
MHGAEYDCKMVIDRCLPDYNFNRGNLDVNKMLFVLIFLRVK